MPRLCCGHIKDHMDETLQRDHVTIVDDSTAGDIWDAMHISMGYHLDRKIPDDLVQNWRETAD